MDHETRKISKQKDFAAWLQAVVAKVVRGIRRRVPNEFKVWPVQFCFRGISYEELAELLRSVATYEEISTDWMNARTSPAGVTTTERVVALDGKELRLSRQEYSGWDGPGFYFDMRESLAEGLEHSRIRELNAQFAHLCAGYRLVDYGPIDSRAVKEDQEG